MYNCTGVWLQRHLEQQNSFTDSLIGTFWLQLIADITTDGNENRQQLVMYTETQQHFNNYVHTTIENYLLQQARNLQ